MPVQSKGVASFSKIRSLFKVVIWGSHNRLKHFEVKWFDIEVPHHPSLGHSSLVVTYKYVYARPDQGSNNFFED